MPIRLPLSPEEVSPALIAIVQKAMAPAHSLAARRGAPGMYDFESGEPLPLGYLEKVEGRLAYATQVGNCVVMEYFTEGNYKIRRFFVG